MEITHNILHTGMKLASEPLFMAGILFLLLGFLVITYFFYRRLRGINVRLIEKNKELEEANNKLSESEKKLQKVHDAQNRMYSVLAHDLRNPANAILGFSQLLERNASRYSEDEIIRFSTIIHKSAKTLYKMLDNILEWSRAQRDQIQLQPECFDLHAMVLNIFALYELSAYSKKIDLETQVKSGTMIFTDKNIASSILRNLVDNALKFTPENGQILVSAYKLKDQIEVWVADSGKGITKEESQQLFNLSSTPNAGINYEGKGSGLGLLLCKEFVEMFRGKIWVESSPGKGSIFKFTLPSCP